MIRRHRLAITGVLLTALFSAASAAQVQVPPAFVQADAAIVRLPPSAIRGLPPAVRLPLEARGCTIPQVGEGVNPSPHNAIRGSFTGLNRVEWAVLCSRERRSAILIFEEATGNPMAEVGERPDITSLQSGLSATPFFSRLITLKLPQDVRRAVGRERIGLAGVLHDGIEDAFIDKGSVIWYWDGTQWLRIQGAD